MKPQNKLGDKLDKIKNKVAYESSKKVSELTRDKDMASAEATKLASETIVGVTKERDTLLLRIEVLQQSALNAQDETRQRILSQSQSIKKLTTRVLKLETGLKYYKEGNHYEKGMVRDKVLDRGEIASEVLDRGEKASEVLDEFYRG